MSDPRPLAGLTALITRPAHQAEELCALIERKGGATSRLPLFAVEPLPNAEEVVQRLTAARDYDAWIFTSANAVRQAYRVLLRATPANAATGAPPRRGLKMSTKSAAGAIAASWPECLVVAGSATAAALAEAGRRDARVPAQIDGAAGILSMPEFDKVRNKRILVVTGENTLPDLARGLQERQAKVETLPVYRRVVVKHPSGRVDSVIRAADVIIISSGESLQRLARAASFASGLASKQLAVPSARVVEHARTLGFLHAPLLPARVTDAAFVETLEHWWRDHPSDID